MSKYERRHKRVDKKWRKLEGKAENCPDCCEDVIGLADSLTNHFSERYWLVCETCHYCGCKASTIRGAIRKWNKDLGSYGIINRR